MVKFWIQYQLLLISHNLELRLEPHFRSFLPCRSHDWYRSNQANSIQSDPRFVGVDCSFHLLSSIIFSMTWPAKFGLGGNAFLKMIPIQPITRDIPTILLPKNQRFPYRSWLSSRRSRPNQTCFDLLKFYQRGRRKKMYIWHSQMDLYLKNLRIRYEN